ncbi:MAG: Ig-like domain-containing protein [Paludibacteraceae bacterium]|nr:Ig-like domain-containing protein [Paludibacteraceae bacterium]
MKKTKFLALAVMALFTGAAAFAQRGYYDAPYTRYEAEAGTVSGGSTQSSYAKSNVTYEASGRTCVRLNSNGSVEWSAGKTFRGIVVRAAGTGGGQTVQADLYVGGNYKTTLNFDMSYGWKNLAADGNSNYSGVTDATPRMRFQEDRYLLDASVGAGTKIKLVAKNNMYIDFVEIEDVSSPIARPSGYKEYTGNGSNLQQWLDSNGGDVYIPAGTYNVGGSVNVGSRKIQGAGMWYTRINFTSGSQDNCGLWSYSKSTEIHDLMIDNTYAKSRSGTSKGINGVWARVENVWVSHFEAGMWFGNYNPGYGDGNCDGMVVKGCRIRYNYADGINFCMGTVNSTASHCDFRSNGDDDMAMWSSNLNGKGACHGNTFEYNTAEFCWFASSCALYGGYNNKWQNIVIRDNFEVGIRVNGKFPGHGYGDQMNYMNNIDVIRCGTWANSYGNVEGAIDVVGQGSVVGDIKNVTLSCINVVDALSEGIWMQGGSSFQNFYFCGVNINGTGVEGLENNNGNKSSWGYGFPVRFADNPSGSIRYKNMTYSNRGGNANSNIAGTAPWSEGGSCSCASVAVTGVTVTPTTATLAVGSGETIQLTANVLPADATNKSVTWSSNNNNIASVSSTGLVTAGNTAGTATITVTTQDGNKKATATITVQTVNVTGIAFESNTATVAINGTTTVKANVQPSNASNQGVTYAITSGSDKATVNATTGVVTGKAAGTAVVTATSAQGNYKATCTITVVACTPVQGTNLETIEVTTNPANPKVGDHVYFTATIRNNASGTVTQGFGVVFGVDGQTTWSNGNEKFLWCDQYKGNDQASSVGKINLTACSTLDFTSNGGAAGNAYWTATEGAHSVTVVIDDNNWLNGATKPNFTYNFTVSNTPQPSVTSVTVTPTNATATVGQTINLTANVTVENGAAKTVTWSSNNNNIQVNNGAVTATAAGTATITATSTVDNTKKGTATVTFNAANVAVTGVTLSANPTAISVGGTSTLTATIQPNNATNKNVTYSIQSGPATINNNVVTATGVGTIVAKVTTADGNKTATVNITASAVAVTGVGITASASTVLVGETVTFDATVQPDNATNKNVTYTVVSGPGTMNGNVLTATGVGEIRVRVTTADGGKTAETTVTATDCNATGGVDLVIADIDWYPRNMINQGDEVTFVITVKNQGGTTLPKNSKLGVVVEIDGPRDYVANSNTYIWSDTYKNQQLPADLQPCQTIVLETNGGDSGHGYWTANGTNHTIYAKVDDSELVAEKDENNNEFTKNLVVGTPTDIQSSVSDAVSITAAENGVVVSGIKAGEHISVFSVLGVRELSFEAKSSQEAISLPQGVHVVRIDERGMTKKVLVSK